MIASLPLAETIVQIIDIEGVVSRAGGDIAHLPFVIRVLLENLVRHRAWGAAVTLNDIEAVLDWGNSGGSDLPLHVSRVILPDSSGLPVLQDLAALRDEVARRGGDVAAVDTQIPVDLVVDHSVQVDHWGDSSALSRNLDREFERNYERYEFLKWAEQAFNGVRVYPPGTGIIHQVNLEHIAEVVVRRSRDDGEWAFPDFVIGGDSHTPMVNALGVLGWGVGGIDAEAALLGHAYTFPVPEVVGVKLVGRVAAPATTTDAALLVTRLLRKENVTGCMVEFLGPAVAQLALAERATIANMAPEYGATCGFFPVDDCTLAYLRNTGRSEEQVALVEAFSRASRLFRGPHEPEPRYSRLLEIDLGLARPSLAGPYRPQELMPLGDVARDFERRLQACVRDGGFGVASAPVVAPSNAGLRHGAIVLAAITSCTNTSNPVVMLAAGLLARKASSLGLTVPPWVKTSLAPGSRSVTRYLAETGLLRALEALGFFVVGYGCTTCGGKSGPLDRDVAEQIERRQLVVAAVLSGNRNFEGRIHKLVRANYIGSPPLVVAYALAGRIDIDLDVDPVSVTPQGRPVFLAEIWPTPHEIAALLPVAHDRALLAGTYDSAAAVPTPWDELPSLGGLRFPWNEASHYLVEPPFFKVDLADDAVTRMTRDLQQARALAAFGDSVTTDHVSPGGEIPSDTPAGRHLLEAGIAPRDFDSYIGRRCNHRVMTRATFANLRIRNLLLPGSEGGVTRHFPDGAVMSIFDASVAYAQARRSLIVLAGRDYGTGSSRDWAAKGVALLGVRAIIAESYERIHRANLVGMGVLPLAFMPGEGWRQLGLTGEETFSFNNTARAISSTEPVVVTAAGDARTVRFEARAQLLTAAERLLMAEGGIPSSVLRSHLGVTRAR